MQTTVSADLPGLARLRTLLLYLLWPDEETRRIQSSLELVTLLSAVNVALVYTFRATTFHNCDLIGAVLAGVC